MMIFRKVYARLVKKLEIKYSGKDVIIIATPGSTRPPKKGSSIVRPRTCTLTAIHDAVLENIVFPTKIVRKLVRYRLDGSKIVKIVLNPKERNNRVQAKNSFWSAPQTVGNGSVFEYPVAEST